MEAENVNAVGNSKLALPIDLNEIPRPSPRGGVHNAAGRRDDVPICPVCRQGVSVGRATEGQTVEDKCFRCLLKNNESGCGISNSRDGIGLERLDINAPPPCDVGEADDIVVTGWNGGKVPASVNCSLQQPSHVNFISPFRESTHGVGLNSSYRTVLESAPESPRSLYLQTLKELIAERSGLIIEGWRVEFDFCDKSYKTSAVYIAPDGTRCKSTEEVARHLGLPSQSDSFDPEDGSKQFAPIQSRTKSDPQNKEPAASLSALNYRQRHASISGSFQDGYPIQFEDFCIISVGHIDARPSYHSAKHIWPVGYRCSWHDRVTGSLFVCDVADGGDSGPLFKVQRYPCSAQSLPVGETILLKKDMHSENEHDLDARDSSSAFQMLEDSMSTVTLLNTDDPPCLDDFIFDSKKECELDNPQEDTCSNSESGVSPKNGNLKGEAVVLSDIIGEFQVEGRSISSVWEMVLQNILHSCREKFKQGGTFKLFCSHDINRSNTESSDSSDSLSILGCPAEFMNPPVVAQSENDLNKASRMLSKWLKQDRFGLDLDFVKEIIEQLPGGSSCSGYKYLRERVLSDTQTVKSGFFYIERKMHRAPWSSKAYHLKWGDTGYTFERDPCPLGKPLKSRLPAYLMGDALQVWELMWRFSEDIGLAKPFSFEELESEILNPWFDHFSLTHGATDFGNVRPSGAVSHCGPTVPDRRSGLLLTDVFQSLLKLLVRELLSKAAVYVCHNCDAVESKARRGKKRDLDSLAALKKRNLEILSVNEITWHEIARRYILAVLAMECNLDSVEIIQRESGKVFHCLQGDGGLLCGSLTGIDALEVDALVLADAMKEIYGSLKGENEIVTVYERNTVLCDGQMLEVNDSTTNGNTFPEWAQVLEPVRKLPTNVGARIRRCVNEALEKNPPEWAKSILEHSISKEVYKGNASGPTKRAVISVLAKLNSDGPQEKTEKKEKVKVKTNLIDLLTKQCRIVLRNAVSSDKDRVFCNLLARVVLNSSDNDDEGILGHAAMVSRPLDFRTIDTRLDAGVYGRSHEAFADDVREVWRSILISYGDRADLVDLAMGLSKKFEDLYEKEVLPLVSKVAEALNVGEPNESAVKERDDLLFRVFTGSLPKAPWEEGICKVCGMDRDDDNVLLCDKCDSEYHRYCLNPPLQKIPDGNWYCPSCVAGVSSRAMYSSSAAQCRKRRNHGEYSSQFLEDLSRFAKMLEIKECWEFTIEERMFLLKFLSDEALYSAFIHDHISQCATQVADLQHKLRSLTSELKLLKFKEEQLNLSVEKARSGVVNELGYPNANESVSPLKREDFSKGKQTRDAPNLPSVADSAQCEQLLEDQTNESLGHHRLEQGDALSSEDGSVKKDTSSLQDSVTSIELELAKMSVRKDFLGRDSNGRAYWSFSRPGTRPCIMACGVLKTMDRSPEEFIGIPDSEQWMSYDSDTDIERLVKWLGENNGRENELRDAILQFQASNKLNNLESVQAHTFSRKESQQNFVSPDLLATKAMGVLESRHGSFCRSRAAISQHDTSTPGMHRCECLQLIWATKNHCPSCHQSFPTIEELKLHSAEKCKAERSVVTRCSEAEDFSRSKKPRLAADEKLNLNAGLPQTLVDSMEANDGCPFNIQEIMARFTVQGSVKDAVNEIGLIGSEGIPSFVHCDSPYLNDPTLSVGPPTNNSWSSEMTIESGNHRQRSSFEASCPDTVKENKGSRGLCIPTERSAVQEGSTVDALKSMRDQVSCGRDKVSQQGVLKNSIIHKHASRPLHGKAADVLGFLKMILLDIDAALLEDALRTSRSSHEKRCAWRAFVRSSRSIYEMVQALITLEDAIKSEYLKTDWWYWSSPSTAARISNLSALATRIYSLDAAIYYDNPPSFQTRVPDEESPSTADHKNSANQSSPTTHEGDTSETPRTRSGKRRRD